MPQVVLGRTKITVEKNGFGALPIQRINSRSDCKKLLLTALQAGITYFDTARMYSDSEEKLADAFADCRSQVFIASKTHSKTPEEFERHLETSLKNLKTDYIDVYQFHNPATCFLPDDQTGMFEAMQKAKKAGKIRFIGFTNHRLSVAQQAVTSGFYDTLQFPFSYLASDEEQQLPALCKAHDIGFVCMKGLAGGLITNSKAAYAFMAQYDNALPIWGVQHPHELAEFVSYISNPPAMTEEIARFIEQERQQLSGSFCRACGYCLPCPAHIDIPTCARMDLLTKRAVADSFRTAESQEAMRKIEDCINCRKCASRCPYGLDTPNLLRENLRLYRNFLAQ